MIRELGQYPRLKDLAQGLNSSNYYITGRRIRTHKSLDIGADP